MEMLVEIILELVLEFFTDRATERAKTKGVPKPVRLLVFGVCMTLMLAVVVLLIYTGLIVDDNVFVRFLILGMAVFFAILFIRLIMKAVQNKSI